MPAIYEKHETKDNNQETKDTRRHEETRNKSVQCKKQAAVQETFVGASSRNCRLPILTTTGMVLQKIDTLIQYTYW